MRIGIIDLGTNSVRFDVHQVSRGGGVHLLHREKLMIRLGQGVFLDQRLDPHAIRRTIQAFLSFRRTAALFQTQKIIAFGTSALREATDSENLVALIRKKTAIDIRVISGIEEAQLIALGILTNELPIRGRFGLVDIGGGSTEISICREKTIFHSASFPLGAYRLQQVFLKSSPPFTGNPHESSSIVNLRRYLKSILLPKMISEEWPKVPKLIGSSGTIRALEKMLRKTTGRDGIQRRSLRKLVKQMSTLTHAELLKIPGMEEKRVDMILSGAILLEECMDAVGASELITTHYSLRDGILDREVHLISHQLGPEYQFHLNDLYEKAVRLSCNEHHIRQVVSLADYLFDQTRRIHKLKMEWKRYLIAAAILHDIGEAVTPLHHEIHSYYIVRHANFLAMEKWEAEFIAQLCLNQNTNRLSKKDLGFTEDKMERQAFMYLLALLRIADALDQSQHSNAKIKKVVVNRDAVKILISGRSITDLEILRTEQKKGLFERMFQRSLTIEKT